MPDMLPTVHARLTIGIVTYNSAAVIGETLDSLRTNLRPNQDARILVRDNGSVDDTLALIREAASHDPRIVVLEGDNVGFGRGNNAILDRVDSRFHVFCNPDILVFEDTIDRCIGHLEAHPKVALVSPRMTFRDGTLQHSNRRHPTVVDLVLRRFASKGLQRLFRRRMAHYEMADIGYDAPCDVPFASGSFMVCRTEALKAVGGFDDRYFLYFEDADLSRMLQEAGWRTVYLPDARVVHGWQRAAHKSLRVALIMARNGVRYFAKWGWRLY